MKERKVEEPDELHNKSDAPLPESKHLSDRNALSLISNGTAVVSALAKRELLGEGGAWQANVASGVVLQ